MTRFDLSDSTLQKTNQWLKELMAELHTQDKHKAYLSLCSVLHAMRDWLQKDDAIYFAGQLPLLIAGIFLDGWKVRTTPEMTLLEFLNRVRLGFHGEPTDPERVTRSVFQVIRRHMNNEEKVMSIIPKDLQVYWPPLSKREGGESNIQKAA
jgi:uncharacterized protein (DUF2267 family)